MSKESRKPEVYDLRNSLICGVAHDDVLKFQISVHNAKIVEIVDRLGQLEAHLFGSLLRHLKSSRVEVVKEVPSLEVLHDYEPLGRRLEEVGQLDQIWVLAHLEHFDLALLVHELLGILNLLPHDLGCELLAALFVSHKLDVAHRALADVAENLVEVSEDVGQSDFPEEVEVQQLVLLLLEVYCAREFGQEGQFDWEGSHAVGVVYFFRLSDERACECVHEGVVALALLVEVDLVAQQVQLVGDEVRGCISQINWHLDI